MPINNHVVARYLDGRVTKGTTNDFFPQRPRFHITLPEGGRVEEIVVAELKAVFFVHSLEGDPLRQDLRGFVAGPGENQKGRKIAVEFLDGELLCGYAQSWSPDRDGFFVFPADPTSNNQRVYVLTAATRDIQAGGNADTLAERVLGKDPGAHQKA